MSGRAYEVVLSGDETLWPHRDAPEFWEEDEDGRPLRTYERLERELRVANKGKPTADEIVARELAGLRHLEAGDRIPREVRKPAQRLVLLRAESEKEAAAIALHANPDLRTVESVTALKG
jgi:hypothetical protein